jgi:hypothetical protein
MIGIGAISPHYIIGIALGAGVYGFFMLCEGAFKVQDDIPPWFIWVHHIGFHTYSYRVFMYNEFHTIEKFDAGAPFANGMDLLKFYSFDTVDVGRPRRRHHIASPCLTPLPCYIPLLGGPRPRRPRRLRHLLPRLLRPRPVLLPHWTSLRAVEKKGVASMRRGAGGSEEERVAGRGRLGCLGLVEDIRAGDCKLKFTDWGRVGLEDWDVLVGLRLICLTSLCCPVVAACSRHVAQSSKDQIVVGLLYLFL